MQDAVDGIFIKDAEISISMEIHFQRLQLQALLVRHIVHGDSAEIWKAGLWADRCIFWDLDGDFVALVLVRECFNVGKWSSYPALSMPLVIPQLRGPLFVC